MDRSTAGGPYGHARTVAGTLPLANSANGAALIGSAHCSKGFRDSRVRESAVVRGPGFVVIFPPLRARRGCGDADSRPYRPTRVVPPKGAPRILLIISDDYGCGVSGTSDRVIPTRITTHPALNAAPRVLSIVGRVYTEYAQYIQLRDRFAIR